MEYTALIFDDCQDETDSYENLVDTINVYKNDPMCKQIVVSCTAEWLLRLAHSPISKVLSKPAIIDICLYNCGD